MSSSIFTFPYVRLYNGAGGINFYSGGISLWLLSALIFDISLRSTGCAAVLISHFGDEGNWVLI